MKKFFLALFLSLLAALSMAQVHRSSNHITNAAKLQKYPLLSEHDSITSKKMSRVNQMGLDSTAFPYSPKYNQAKHEIPLNVPGHVQGFDPFRLNTPKGQLLSPQGQNIDPRVVIWKYEYPYEVKNPVIHWYPNDRRTDSTAITYPDKIKTPHSK